MKTRSIWQCPRDPIVICGILAALIFWCISFLVLRPDVTFLWAVDDPLHVARFVLVYPVLEELVFRGLVQGELRRRLPSSPATSVSLANLLTSILFVVTHLLYHPPLWAAAVFLPSLVFGYLRDRYGSLLPPILLHVFYNAGYHSLFGPA